jgi:hypothetical protein
VIKWLKIYQILLIVLFNKKNLCKNNVLKRYNVLKAEAEPFNKEKYFKTLFNWFTSI